jgi:thioredoxin 1
MIAPYFEELSKQYTNLKFIKVDVDELEDVAAEAGVSAMPTFMIFKGGKKIEEIVGANKEKLADLCKKYN